MKKIILHNSLVLAIVAIVLGVSVFLILNNVARADVIFGSASSAANSSGNSNPNPLTIPAPSAIAVGDFLIASISFNGGSATAIAASSTGWTLIARTNNSTDVGMATYYKFAGSSEPSSYIWNISNSSHDPRASGGIIRYTGVANPPVDVFTSGTGSTGSNKLVTAPSATTTVSSDLVLVLFSIDERVDSSGFTPQTPLVAANERFDVKNTDARGPSISAVDFSQAGAGPTGARSSKANGTGTGSEWAAQTIAIKMASNDPTLTVNKVVVPSVDTGKFNLQIDGGTLGTGADAGNGGTTGAITVTAGVHSVSETAGTDTNLSDYTAVFGGDCDADGNVVLSGGQNKTCTITNTKNGIVIIKKVMVGGADNFDFTGAPSGTISANNGTVSTSVVPSQYISTETAVAGWELSSVSCDDADSVGNVVNKNATFNVAAGETVTCTFTNTKLATLTVNKILINDDGGIATTSDFSFQVNSGTIIPFETDGQNNLLVPGGTYTVTETVTPGYTPMYDNCESVVIPDGGTDTCTITNNDNAPVPPSLTLVKQVVNDNGGAAVFSDWTVFADGPTPISGEGATSSAAIFSPGTYTLSESAGPSGYAASDWVCTGDVANTGTSITLDLGQSATCTITNDDIAPSLTLNKVVMNDNGGMATTTDWILMATDSDEEIVLSGEGSAESDSDFQAGTYTLSESGPDGYIPSAWSCMNGVVVGEDNSITLGLGQTATCTVTNDDIATTIVGKKFSDLNENGVFDENESIGAAGWHIALGKVGTPQEGTTTIPIEIVALSLTGTDGVFAISVPTLGNYKIFEEKRSGWVPTTPAPAIDSFFDITYSIDLQGQQIPLVPDSFFDVFVDASGQTISTVGENVPIRFGNHQLPIIHGEASINVLETSAVITWLTDPVPGTSRVVYDTISHSVLGVAPDYGYASSTVESDIDPYVSSHSVALADLLPGSTYFYRTISRGSPEVVGDEKSFTTVTPAPVPTPTPTPTPPIVSSGGGGGGIIGFFGTNSGLSFGFSVPQTVATPSAPLAQTVQPPSSGSATETGAQVALTPEVAVSQDQPEESGTPLAEAPLPQGSTDIDDGTDSAVGLATAIGAIPEQTQTANILSVFTALSLPAKLLIATLLLIAIALGYLLFFLIDHRKREERNIPTIKGKN